MRLTAVAALNPPGVGNLQLQIVGIAALEGVLHRRVACVALYRHPLNLEANIAACCQFQISTLALWALVRHCSQYNSCDLSLKRHI